MAPSGAETAGFRGRGGGRSRHGESLERGGPVRAARRPGGIGQARQERLPGFEQALAGGDLGDALVETVAVEERLAGKPIEMGAQGPDPLLVGLLHGALARQEPSGDVVPEDDEPDGRGRPQGQDEQGRAPGDQGAAADRDRAMLRAGPTQRRKAHGVAPWTDPS